MKSCRTNSKYQEYDGDEIKRLEMILILQGLSFGIQDIAGLFLNEGVGFNELLEKRITQSNKALFEIREVNQLLNNFKTELSNKSFSKFYINEMLKDYSYITKQAERTISMIPPYEEKTA